MKVKVYGTKTSGHQAVVSTIRRFVDQAGIECEIQEVSDVSSFLDMHLESVPAVQIDDDQVISLKANGTFNRSLRKVIKEILQKKDFGQLLKVVIPIDFSDVSTNAFHFGHRLATDMGAIVKLVHVHFLSAAKVNDGHRVDMELQLKSNKQLEEYSEVVDLDWASELMTSALVQNEFRVGFPAAEILDVAEKSEPAMIVMGATGDRNGLATIFGSVSRQVMRDAHRPVLIIREGTRYKGMNRLLYAYDESDIHDECVFELVKIAGLFDAEIHIVHIQDEQIDTHGYDILDRLKESYPKSKLTLAQRVNSNVVDGLNSYAEEHQIDVIAMGTTHKGVFQRLFGKSTTKQMVLNTSYPLLILKPQS